MSGSIKRFHSQIHFQLNELILFYNFPIISEEVKNNAPCHHIEKLRCSRADELTSDECINVRKCELYHNKARLFTTVGIDVNELKLLDQELRNKT